MRRSRPWRGFRSVLCAVDFSEQSAIALQYAAMLAARGGASLTALHVADPLLTAAASAALHDRDAAERSERELRRFTDAYLADADGGAFTRSERVRVGAPADEILETAAAGADVIVLGTAGLTGARRLIMGSTTLSVLQRTTVPVLAVPAPPDAAPPPASWPHGVIVAAVDLDERTAGEIEAAADVAGWLGASLIVVHVADAAARAAATSRLSDMAAHVDAAVRVHTLAGGVGREVAAFAAAERAGLVVTMLRDRQGWFGPSRGSVSYDVVTNATVPVLALPNSESLKSEV